MNLESLSDKNKFKIMLTDIFQKSIYAQKNQK